MDRKPNAIQVGAIVLASALALRLLAGGVLQPVWGLLTRPETAAVLLYLESGRVVDYHHVLSYPMESPVPTASLPPQKEKAPAFGAEDLKKIDVDWDFPPLEDVPVLMEQSLDWALDDGLPRVLILHTHGTECYTRQPGENFELQPNYRTLDEDYNMLSIGAEVCRLLEEAGIKTVQDRQIHDYPSFNSSYSNARQATQENLRAYPTVSLVLDLHRDAADTPTGQMDTSARVNGQESAQLMLVLGSEAGGLEHPGWQDNLAMGLKLQATLEKLYPGLCRPLNVCTMRFNEDLSPGALLIEVGAAGNSHQEAMVAARALAEGIIALAGGANLTADSAS